MKLDENIPLLIAGDNHGDWNGVFSYIKEYNIENCYYIHVGDGGEGFLQKDKQLRQFENLNKLFKEKNIRYFSIRGNHSDPSYFKGETRIKLSNYELIEDYSVYEYGNKKIQFIGGAISIDRTHRKLNVSYWSDEGVDYQISKCQKVDLLITHTAPSVCFPQKFNELVYGWSKEDVYLIEDLTKERLLMDEIFKVCKPTIHCYGHFHSSWTEEIENCFHKLLDIGEVWQYPY